MKKERNAKAISKQKSLYNLATSSALTAHNQIRPPFTPESNTTNWINSRPMGLPNADKSLNKRVVNITLKICFDY